MKTEKDMERAETILRTMADLDLVSRIEMLVSVFARISAEAADQARKEAAERAVGWIMKRIVPGVFADILVQDIRFSILTDTETNKKTDHLPDTGKKLAIAVKALEEIKQIRKAGPAFESHFSKLQDIGRITNDALKEIQG